MSILSTLLINGIIANPFLLTDWQKTPYIVGLKKEFEKIHNHYQEKCLSEIGALFLRGEDTLIPRYVLRLKDGSIKEISCQTESIALSDLIHDKEKIEEIKKEGYLVVVKYDNER